MFLSGTAFGPFRLICPRFLQRLPPIASEMRPGRPLRGVWPRAACDKRITYWREPVHELLFSGGVSVRADGQQVRKHRHFRIVMISARRTRSMSPIFAHQLHGIRLPGAVRPTFSTMRSAFAARFKSFHTACLVRCFSGCTALQKPVRPGVFQQLPPELLRHANPPPLPGFSAP